VLLSFRSGRWALRLSLLSAALIVVLTCFTTFGYVLITPLESRFVRPPEPARIDGIVVLGGGMDGEVNSVRGGWEFNRSGDRFVETLRLALAHPEAKIVIAAGPAALAMEQEPEAIAAKRFFVAFGIAPDRLVLDDKSRNTEENAQFAEALAGATDGRTWLLVTSGVPHAPLGRAVSRHGFSGRPLAGRLSGERRGGPSAQAGPADRKRCSQHRAAGMGGAPRLQADRQDRRSPARTVMRIARMSSACHCLRPSLGLSPRL